MNINFEEAEYHEALLGSDKGNPYIEALPLPRSSEEIRRAYTKILPIYRYSDVKNMTKLEKMLAVSELRSLRFPLPFHEELEFDFYNALLTSYRARKPLGSAHSHEMFVSNGEEYEQNSILTGDSADSTNAGFSLIGYSGCGKSSAISTLVSHYPQVIYHDNGTMKFPQIVYLVVNCTANSNFAALYEGIGDAIDKALGNIKPVYAVLISKQRSLGKKAEVVRQLVERFAIGVIILDEIQLIDFAHTKENTFESLMTLSNRTKVAIAVVGTEDARDKMFKELRTSRRIGKMICGHNYCKHKEYFAFLTRTLMSYQWFDEVVDITDDIIDTLYDLTKGTIDQLVGIYIAVHMEYFRRKGTVKVTPEFIRDAANKYYPNMQSVLESIEENSAEFETIRQMGEDKISTEIDEEKQKAQMREIIHDASKQNNINRMLANVISNILTMYDFSESQIEKAFNRVVVKHQKASEKELSRLTLEELNRPKVLKRKPVDKSKVPTVEAMKEFLEV